MEFDVVKQIKKYWNKFIGFSGVDRDEEFTDATSEHSVRTSKFLEGLNLDPIMPEINKHYSVKDGDEKYPRRAMVKTMIWRIIKKIRYYTRTENYLKDHPYDAIELGFNIE